MEVQRSAVGRYSAIAVAMALVLSVMAWLSLPNRAGAASPMQTPAALDIYPDVLPGPPVMSVFAKFSDIDGESVDENHDTWIEILTADWGLERTTKGSPARARGGANVHDMVLTFYYDKSAPKLQERCFKGEVIPQLEVEAVKVFESGYTFLRYELKNVLCTVYQDSLDVESGLPPTVTVAVTMEEMKTIYTEFDDEGGSAGTVETEFKVGK